MKVRGDLEMISKRVPNIHQTLSTEKPKRLWNWSIASTWEGAGWLCASLWA